MNRCEPSCDARYYHSLTFLLHFRQNTFVQKDSPFFRIDNEICVVMIKRIVSGGQSGVDRAALDVAIKLSIAHGGWVPRGRLTENGPLPLNYHLKETSSSRYSVRTEKNVVDTDGTLILSHGALTGGTEYTREMAIRHDRPWLHIDLGQTAAFHAATTINHWIRQKKIEILNVAGARASEDPAIYTVTLNILESVYYLGFVENNIKNMPSPS